MQRNIAIITSVVLLHLAALWALHTGLLHRLVQAVVPAQVLVQITPSATQALQPQATPHAAPVEQKKTLKAPSAQVAVAQAATKSIAETPAPVTPAPAPVLSAAPTTQPAAPAASASATAAITPASTPPVTAPAPPKLELPSSNADYLNNPKPHYPPMSKRLGEQGKVVVRTLIGADGTALQAEIKQSSGFERLDQAALTTALRWRYVPGKRAGVPEAMWFNVPFQFLLE